MRCDHCGEELPGGTPVCLYCGTAQAASISPPPPVPMGRGKRLRRLHTSHWKGECPSCGEVHTVENARCPIDGAPLVVSLDAPRWNPLILPIHTAEMRCVRGCAFQSPDIPCNKRDGIIGGRYLSFRFSIARTLLYHSYHLLCLAAFLAVAVPAVTVILSNIFYVSLLAAGTDVTIIVRIIGLLVVCLIWTRVSLMYWWPLRIRFTFHDVVRGSR